MTTWLSRSTIFAAFFAVTAFLLAMRSHLDHSYVESIIAIHGFVTVRAIAEDHKPKS